MEQEIEQSIIETPWNLPIIIDLTSEEKHLPKYPTEESIKSLYKEYVNRD